MNLLRYAAPGTEKPGLLDAGGRVHDRSAYITDIASTALTPEGLAAIAKLDTEALPIPAEPIILNKWTSSIVGPNDAIQIPHYSTRTD